MAEHAIPRLFVSQRSDKNPNGFNCAICRKDISFLSKGEPKFGVTSGVRPISCVIGGTDSTMRITCTPLDSMLWKSHPYQLSYGLRSKELQQWFLVVRTRSSKMRWMLWLGCHRTFLLPLLWGVYSSSYEVVGRTASSEGYGISSGLLCQLIPSVLTRLGARQSLLLFLLKLCIRG